MESNAHRVHDLDPSTFKPFIESKDVVLLSVHILPFSQRCQTFVHEFQKIAVTMKDSNITFAQMNALNSGGVLVPYHSPIFPHLVLFQGLDNWKAYSGALDETDITSYLGRFLQFPVLSEISATSLPEFKRCHDVVVVGFVEADDQHAKERLKSLARTTHPEYLFGLSEDPALAKLENVEMPGIAVYKVSDRETTVLPFMDDMTLMITNLRHAARRLIVDLIPQNHEELLDMGLPLGYIFTNDLEERVRLWQEIEPLAREYRKHIQFGIADPAKMDDVVDDLHVDISQLPAFAIRNPTANRRYPKDPSTDPFLDSMKHFVEDFLHQKLQPTIKSEPLPAISNDAVVKVVGLNYHEIVMDKTKDVLLTFCITPCGPCDALQPTLVKLAEMTALSPVLRDKVTIAKVMYDENDTEERDIRGFPTIKIYPAAAKNESVQFLGNRTLDDLADFIRDHGTHKVDLRWSEQQHVVDEERLSTSSKKAGYVCNDDVCVTVERVDAKSNDHVSNVVQT